VEASGAELRVVRGLGEPALFAVAASAIGATIYVALGLVAGDALALTPLAFLVAAIFFVLTMMTYVEGNSRHAERGGASTFARYAFNELWSFIAGWAILLDYLIVIALATFAISHYVAAFWGEAGSAGPELLIAAGAIAFIAVTNIRGLSAERMRLVLRIGLVNTVLLGALTIAAAITLWDPAAIVDSVDLGNTPEWDEFVFAAVVACIVLTGLEAASGFAGEIRVGRAALRRVVIVGAGGVLLAFVGVSIVALMAVPVENGATALGERYVEAPLLGVASAFDEAGLRDTFRYAIGATAAVVLLTAAQGQMLGLSRLAYSLATNRQIPSAVGKLGSRHSTPYVTIIVASLLTFALVIPRDVDFLAGIFAFGAMLAFTIAHVAVIVMRFREPDSKPAFRIPLSIAVGGASLPLPAVAGALLGTAGWISVIVLHDDALLYGGLWMLAGLVLYVVYRKTQGKSLVKRFTISAEALQKDLPGAEYGSILVPVLGTELDDDIVGTAGRLAREEAEPGEEVSIEAIYFIEIPMSLPINARVRDDRRAEIKNALARAKRVGEEYEGVNVHPTTVRTRTLGAGIVEEARRRGVEVIVLAAERPTRVRGGALLGGRGGPRDKFAGDMTRHVLEKAPCRVVLTAAPADDEGTREGVAP